MKKTPATTTEMTSAASASDHYVSNITLPVAKAGSYIGTFPIDQIKVATRHRQDLGDIAALAESVRKLGLLQPIGIGRDRNFIFGEHRLRACQYLGLDTIQARIIDVDSLLAEHDENEMRKGFAASERVALAEAIKAEIGNRQGQRNDLKTSDKVESADRELVAHLPEVAAGKRTRDIAAAKAGFASTTQYRQAKAVVEQADPALTQAMDKGDIAIATAAKLAKAAPEVQRAAVADPKAAPSLARGETTSPRNPKPLRAAKVLNAGVALVAVRDALVALMPLEAGLSRDDARVHCNNLKGALSRIYSRWPDLAPEPQGGIARA